MWYNNKAVSFTHCKTGSQQCWAIIEGISGWQRIRVGFAESVTSIAGLLSIAKANGRKVDVYIKNNLIEEVTLR